MTCQKIIEDSPMPLSLSVAAAVVALAAAVGFSSLTPNSVAKESKRNLFSVDMSGLQSMTDLTLLRRADVLLPISLWVRGRCSLSLSLARSAGGGKKRRDLPSFRRGGEMEVSGVGRLEGWRSLFLAHDTLRKVGKETPDN